MLREKIQHLQKLLDRQNIHTLFVGNFGHQIADDLMYYLLLEKLECGLLVLPKEGKATLYAISFEVNQLASRLPEMEVRPFDKHPTELLKPHLIDNTVVGIRPSALPGSLYKKLLESFPNHEWQDLSQEEKKMAIKLPKEQEYMQKAARATDMIFAELLKQWRNFFTEMDAANFLLREMAERALEPSFPPIVASGLNAANPHHHPTFKKIQNGFCVIDFGVRFKGYCSDMTRTIFVGTPKEEEKQLYDHLLLAQTQTISKVGPGIATHELDAFCRVKLGEDLNKKFVHSLGHGIGTQVHEWPRVGAQEDVILEEGMIITIEPGIYCQNRYGIRIEDDVLVTQEGCDVLTKSNKEFFCLN